jgi:hypothetical protein
MYLLLQGILEHVEGGRISNKKYDAELLHPVTQNALESHGIPEAYTWLEACVKEEDIAVGRALEASAARGSLGRLHEVGAGQRVAPVLIMEPSPHLGDTHRFWRLPADVLAMPVEYDDSRPLPNVRYKDPRQVPDQFVASDEDSDDRPLLSKPRKRQHAKKRKKTEEARNKARQREQVKKRKKEKEAAESALTVDEVHAGRLVVTHDNYGTDEKPQPGFSVCKIVGDRLGTADDPSWSYQHLLSSKKPHLKAVVGAKFGLGKGSVVDALGGQVVHFYTIVAAFDVLRPNGQLPMVIRRVIKGHRDWAALQ